MADRVKQQMNTRRARPGCLHAESGDSPAERPGGNGPPGVPTFLSTFRELKPVLKAPRASPACENSR